MLGHDENSGFYGPKLVELNDKIAVFKLNRMKNWNSALKHFTRQFHWLMQAAFRPICHLPQELRFCINLSIQNDKFPQNPQKILQTTQLNSVFSENSLPLTFVELNLLKGREFVESGYI